MTGNNTNLMTRHNIICAVPCEAPAFFGLSIYLSSHHSYSDSWSAKREELPLCMEFLESSPTCQNSHNPNHHLRKRGWDVAVIVNCVGGNCTGLAKQFCQIILWEADKCPLAKVYLLWMNPVRCPLRSLQPTSRMAPCKAQTQQEGKAQTAAPVPAVSVSAVIGQCRFCTISSSAQTLSVDDKVCHASSTYTTFIPLA